MLPFIKTNYFFHIMTQFLISGILMLGIYSPQLFAQNSATQPAHSASTTTTAVGEQATEFHTETNMGSTSIITRSLEAGPVVFLVLVCLIAMSLMSWAIAAAKWFHLKKLVGKNQEFIKSFWDSRSLNDLNGRLGDYPYSPVKEVFRNGYPELVRGSQLKEQALTSELAISVTMDNLQRSLNKAKMEEKKKMEKFLPLLATTASAAPFIGLFGTVWGIMTAFEQIARSGSASLAAVAPGISEALIATAFGLAAAIPAVIGYNIASSMIRGLVSTMDGFCADYLNISERFLVVDKTKAANNTNANTIHTPRI